MAKSKDALSLIRLALVGQNLSAISREAGMTVRQVRNIRDGVTKRPRWDTMQALSRILKIPLS